jgi:hypothetical protein
MFAMQWTPTLHLVILVIPGFAPPYLFFLCYRKWRMSKGLLLVGTAVLILVGYGIFSDIKGYQVLQRLSIGQGYGGDPSLYGYFRFYAAHFEGFCFYPLAVLAISLTLSALIFLSFSRGDEEGTDYP